MKTVLLKTVFIVVPLCLAVCCFSQKNKTRTAYEYVVQKDSTQNKKETKLKTVREEKYTENNTTTFNNLAVNYNNQNAKDKNYNYQFEENRKSVSIKKFEKKTNQLLTITNIYFGTNNKIYDETIIDKSNDNYFSKHYLYNRQGRLVKIINYLNGKESGYILYEYNDESSKDNYSSM